MYIYIYAVLEITYYKDPYIYIYMCILHLQFCLVVVFFLDSEGCRRRRSTSTAPRRIKIFVRFEKTLMIPL